MISTIDRKRIFIFVAITYGITIMLALVIYLNGGIFVSDIERSHLATILMMVMMFAPAVGNLATRLITREGWSNTYLRPNLRRGWPYYLAAWTLPLVAIVAGGAIYYLLFPGKFDPSLPFARQMGIMNTDPQAFLTREIFNTLKLAPVIMFIMFGEEFGWRAYLLPKLMPLGGRKAVLLVGAIWGAFHWPLILMGYEYRFGYWGEPVTGMLLFVLVTMLGDNVLFAWMTLRTGSVWPVSIAHGVGNNSGLLMVYFLSGEWDRMIGPSTVGIVGFLGYALLALVIMLSPRALAPLNMVISKRPAAIEKAADQAKLGTTS